MSSSERHNGYENASSHEYTCIHYNTNIEPLVSMSAAYTFLIRPITKIPCSFSSQDSHWLFTQHIKE